MSKQKLELMWVGKEKRAKLEPRILIEDPEKSYHADKRVSDNDIFDNMLIHGDNLLALKALEQDYAGRVKCIYIDPPYNTGNAFEHYDDGLEHSIWLSLMRERLELLKNLLSEDGVIFVNLDENEHAYCKVLCDEIFGRINYIGDLIWQKRKGGGNDSHFFALDHDYILVYAKNSDKKFHVEKWRVSQSENYLKRYKEIDKNGDRFYWDTLARDGLQNPIPVTIKCPDGSFLSINSQKSKDTIEIGLREGSIRLIKSKNGWTLHHRVYMPKGQVLRSILTEVGTNKTAGDEITSLFGNNKSFDYPKPESLIFKLLELTTNPGDLVLDSFLGSGTTAAVAHKMGRRWIGIELGEHCDTHCVPRLKKVIDGEDAGGITKSANWRGGGGFRYYNLAPSLVKFDEWGNPVINKDFNENMLVRALCKVEGFNFDPSPDVYWKQGKSTESDFIYVTTQHLTAQMLQKLSDDVGDSCTLLICCGSFDGKKDSYSNLTIKKIPKAILKKCEWNHDDYSLEIKNLPMSAPDPQPSPAPRKKSFKKQQDDNQLDLF